MTVRVTSAYSKSALLIVLCWSVLIGPDHHDAYGSSAVRGASGQVYCAYGTRNVDTYTYTGSFGNCHAGPYGCGGDPDCPGYKRDCSTARQLIANDLATCAGGLVSPSTMGTLGSAVIDTNTLVVSNIGSSWNDGFFTKMGSPGLPTIIWEALDSRCDPAPDAALAIGAPALGTFNVINGGGTLALTFDWSGVSTVEIYSDSVVVDTFQVSGPVASVANVPTWPFGFTIRARGLADSSIVGVSAMWLSPITITLEGGQTVVGDQLGIFTGNAGPVDSVAVTMKMIPSMKLLYEEYVIPPTLTAVPSVASSEAPGLASPWPNPFGSSMAIPFTLAAAGRAELRIYDVAGRLVRWMAGGQLGPGRHTIVWDGRDEARKRLPTGAYFYELTVDQKTVGSKKVVLLR